MHVASIRHFKNLFNIYFYFNLQINVIILTQKHPYISYKYFNKIKKFQLKIIYLYFFFIAIECFFRFERNYFFMLIKRNKKNKFSNYLSDLNSICISLI